eukprot:TRINITY_DN7555_c0_g1_i3.p1 TRINITY_DN7555_c0_g1~~TRINITY_DN7555_c0_g1_i3.p1  ORF type:complete len:191 (+),score=34.01 TRINITY_DN7555_c0_g1_i3:87-659(+)
MTVIECSRKSASVPAGLRKYFNHEDQVVVQVVEKVHRSGRKDNRVLVVRNMGIGDLSMVFLCTLDGCVRRVMKLSSICRVAVVDSGPYETPQLILSNNDDCDWVLNLIQHKLNSSERSVVEAVDEIKYLWEKVTQRKLPLFDLRGTGRTVQPYKGLSKTEPKVFLRKILKELSEKSISRMESETVIELLY